FWTWHDAIEDRHAEHTDDELAVAFARPGFDQSAFMMGGTTVLDAVEGFWSGLAERGRAVNPPVAVFIVR
ncbi:MAG: hypothetical protein M3N13_03980, partial [Candidatus Eremiobacteraeota bacterium]|nr:hypothetical protein [Candidatus Eremiobacteraeota bacterium]